MCFSLYHKHDTNKKALSTCRYGIISRMKGKNPLPAQSTLPPPDPLVQQCAAAQARHQLFPVTREQAQPVVVAVSGGADSVALLHLLHILAPTWRLRLHVAHLDHSLRPESAADAQFVAALADQWQLPFHHRQLPVGALTAGDEGIEAAGRQARYAFLTEVALQVTPMVQTPIIALAHHADDQAETLLLHLVRGSGLSGLGGMRWRSVRWAGDLWPDAPSAQQQRRLHLVRPFLGAQRADLLRYLQAAGLSWRVDSTNQDQRFVRNRLRHDVLPALAEINGNVAQTLARSAAILQAEADRLEALDQAALLTVLIEPRWSPAVLQMWQEQNRSAQLATAPVRVVLDLTKFGQLSVAAQRGVLRKAFSLVTKQGLIPDFAQIETLLTAVQPPLSTSGPHSLLADVAWTSAGAIDNTPARLSLHPVDALPFAPTHPFLTASWRATAGAQPLPIGAAIRLDDGWTLAVTPLPIAALPPDWRTTGDGWQVYLDADQIGHPVLTTPQPGYSFAPLGMNGRHKTVGDFFTDRKIPVALRPGWPLIVDQQNNEVLWIGGYQPSHRVRITAQTRRVLRLAWIREDRKTEEQKTEEQKTEEQKTEEQKTDRPAGTLTFRDGDDTHGI
ncbi:MAG: tRNA lysidine(34) synthetase TilS [Caldilinea sp. CFX5]|nr:tRNA lysidine(34) synthetase TilS [Caldilinea sp. CFX5]